MFQTVTMSLDTQTELAPGGECIDYSQSNANPLRRLPVRA